MTLERFINWVVYSGPDEKPAEVSSVRWIGMLAWWCSRGQEKSHGVD